MPGQESIRYDWRLYRPGAKATSITLLLHPLESNLNSLVGNFVGLAQSDTPLVLPLVSVLIRSMDRAFLAQALDSIALQTYPHIEVVVLAVKPDHMELGSHCGKFPLRLVPTDQPIMRSPAANRAMEAAQGEFLIFLDDDDWMMPGHVARLAEVLLKLPQSQAAYTGIGLVDAKGKPMGQAFDMPFDPIRQIAGNMTPIHSVLFRAAVMSLGCRFDETLDHLEDWDFWLQVAKLSPMVHLPGVSAVYRIHESSGVHTDTGPEGKATQRIYEKWEPYWTQQQVAQIMQRVWTHPELETRLNESNSSLAVANQTLAGQQSAIAEQGAVIANQSVVIAEQTADLEKLQAISAALSESLVRSMAALSHSEETRLSIINSRFWRMTWPMRWAATYAKSAVLSPVWGQAFRFLKLFLREGRAGVNRRLHPLVSATPIPAAVYSEWARTHDALSATNRALLEASVASMGRTPLISIVMPVYNPPLDLLDAAVASIKHQIYPNWELCLADDASPNSEVWLLLQRLALSDKRIKAVRRETNGHISQASNSALELATGELIALMDNDDLLPPDALYWVAEAALRNPDVQIIYSDEDKLDAQGNRFDAYMKSDWNYTLFLGHNMISHLGVYRTQLVRDVGGFRMGLEGSQDYDLALRCIERIDESQIVHIPRVLYHWRAIETSTALNIESKPYALDAGQRALQDHLVRIGSTARAERMPSLNYRCVRETGGPGDNLSLVLVYPIGDIATASTPDWSTDPKFNIIEVLHCTSDASSLNATIASAKGRLVALLRAVVKPDSPSALLELIGYVLEQKTGAAAGTIRDPASHLVSGGLVLNQVNIASVLHKGLPAANHGYVGRAFLAQELSAVAMECVVLRKEVFMDFGGFDLDLGINAMGSAAWCLRLRELGYRIVWCPNANWTQQTGIPSAANTQFALHRQIFMNRYGRRYASWLLHDPAYHPALDSAAADFSLLG